MCKHELPPLPAAAPGVCVGMEGRAGACCWPRHYGSSALTGSQTREEKRAQAFSVTCFFHFTIPLITLSAVQTL